MPSIMKRKTSHVQASGFELYTGDEPRPGGYRAVVKQLNVQKSSNGNLMFTGVIELHAKPGSSKAQYDGWAGFPMIVLTDVEANVQREQALYLAICGKEDADTKTDVDPAKFKDGDKQKAKVLAIGGVNPAGKVVNVRLTNRTNADGSMGIQVDSIFRIRDEDGESAEESSIEDEDDEEEIEAEDVVLYEEDDLKALSLPALRKVLVDEFDTDEAEAKAIKSKAALVAAILAAQEEEDDDEDDEEEDEDEEDEEDEDEEEEEDPEEVARDEVAEYDRTRLKAEIKERAKDQKITVKMTDDDLREILVKLMVEEPPF